MPGAKSRPISRKRSSKAFTDKCVAGITANRERCEELIEYRLAMCTALTPEIGYDAIAKKAFETGKTVPRRPKPS